MITGIGVIRRGRAVEKEAPSDSDENKENMFFDCNVEDSCNKINLKQDDREFGADLTKIILNEPKVCLPINSKIFSSLNNTQFTFNEKNLKEKPKVKDNTKKIFALTKEPQNDPKEGEKTKASTKDQKNTKITEFCKKKKRNTVSGVLPEHEMNQNFKRQTSRNITSSLPHIVEHPVENSMEDSSSISVSTRNSISLKNYSNEETMSCEDDSNYFVHNINVSKNSSMVTNNLKEISSRSGLYDTNLLKSLHSDTNKNSNRIRSGFLNQREYLNFLSANRRNNFLLIYSPINEYLEEIYINLKTEERKLIKENTEEEKTIADSYAKKLNYMSLQTDINEEMRAILINWLVDVHLKFRYRTKTLFLAISIIDRYLTKQNIVRAKFQLLGVTALLVASKHEEINTRPIIHFVFFTDNAFTKEEICEMERNILRVLNYEILSPTQHQFYEIICLILGLTKKEISFGRFLMESFMIDYKSTLYLPSLIACSTIYIVLKFFKFRNYSIIYSDFFNSNHKISAVKECAKDICDFVDVIGKSTLRSVRNKFGQKDVHEFSEMNNKTAQ